MATIQFYRWTMYKFTRYMLKGNLITFRVIFVAGLKELKKKFICSLIWNGEILEYLFYLKVVRAYLKFETKDNHEVDG